MRRGGVIDRQTARRPPDLFLTLPCSPEVLPKANPPQVGYPWYPPYGPLIGRRVSVIGRGRCAGLVSAGVGALTKWGTEN